MIRKIVLFLTLFGMTIGLTDRIIHGLRLSGHPPSKGYPCSLGMGLSGGAAEKSETAAGIITSVFILNGADGNRTAVNYSLQRET